MRALDNQEEELKAKLKKLKKENKTTERAQEILQKIAKETQEQLHYNISETVSMALSILDRPYEVELRFSGKRNNTDCEIKFKRDGKIFTPMISTGGAVKEMAGIALRCAVNKMATSQPRPILLLDEPFRSLGALREVAIKVLRRLADILEIQIIITTHDTELMEIKQSERNRIIDIENIDGVSKVS